MNLNMNPNPDNPYMNPNETADHLRRYELKESPEGVPLYPSETENPVLVTRWAEAFEDYAATKDLKKTLTDGTAAAYPQYLRQALLSTDTATRTRAQEQKEELDAVADAKLYGLLRIATRDTAPALYAQVRADNNGKGSASFTWLTTRVKNKTLADAYAAQEIRDAWARVPTPRYILTSDWDAKITNYDKLNQACGDFELGAKQVVFAYYNMLPASFRAAHYLSIDDALENAAPCPPRRKRAIVLLGTVALAVQHLQHLQEVVLSIDRSLEHARRPCCFLAEGVPPRVVCPPRDPWRCPCSLWRRGRRRLS